MKLLHAMTRRRLVSSLFFAFTNVCVAQSPMMIGTSGTPGSSDSGVGMRIVEPAEGETVHDNTGSMIVRVEEEPALKAETVQLLVDGNPVAAQRDGEAFIVSGLERGTHHLQARSIDANGETVQSQQVTFNVWRASSTFRRPGP